MFSQRTRKRHSARQKTFRQYCSTLVKHHRRSCVPSYPCQQRPGGKPGLLLCPRYNKLHQLCHHSGVREGQPGSWDFHPCQKEIHITPWGVSRDQVGSLDIHLYPVPPPTSCSSGVRGGPVESQNSHCRSTIMMLHPPPCQWRLRGEPEFSPLPSNRRNSCPSLGCQHRPSREPGLLPPPVSNDSFHVREIQRI